MIPLEDSRWEDGCGALTVGFVKNEDLHVMIP